MPWQQGPLRAAPARRAGGGARRAGALLLGAAAAAACWARSCAAAQDGGAFAARGASPPEVSAGRWRALGERPRTTLAAGEEDLSWKDAVTVSVGVQGTSLTGSNVREEVEVDVYRVIGEGSQFFTVETVLPLGLNISRRDSGPLIYSFVVENVLEGGSAFREGKIKPGDVIAGITALTTEMVDGFGAGVNLQSKAVILTSNILSVKDLVTQIGSNQDGRITLLCERGSS